MSCNAAISGFGVRLSGDSRVVWIIPVFQLLTEQNNVIGRCPRSGFTLPPAIRAGAGLRLAGKRSRAPWGAGGASPTNARATAAPPKAPFGHGDCGRAAN